MGDEQREEWGMCKERVVLSPVSKGRSREPGKGKDEEQIPYGNDKQKSKGNRRSFAVLRMTTLGRGWIFGLRGEIAGTRQG